MSKEKLPLSLVVITLNEEKNIERCLKSADFVNDIIVLDSFSKDKTKDICLSLGARFLEQSWLGFGEQKAKAVSLANNDWILSLDADEEITPELREEICRRWTSLDENKGYYIPRISFYLNRWIRHGGWYPDYQLRLFHRKKSHWAPVPIHEKVISPSTEKFNEPMAHYVFSKISDQVVTNDKYSSLQAIQMLENGKSFSYFHLVTKPLVKFIECYVYKRGFMDGLPGFIIAVSAGYSVFLKWAKLWELEKNR
ncbi:MAG: glycosyltransferase family 2 protein [Bdellovibrionaceae bacterium]|nr:glycosyltransferase family 2 protein [Pseudobdellovibrionaceae bacterium]NUM58244.1 glycosyltransferase family 2 protein [Pseudobdellovibrionaceae bacterium]